MGQYGLASSSSNLHVHLLVLGVLGVWWKGGVVARAVRERAVRAERVCYILEILLVALYSFVVEVLRSG